MPLLELLLVETAIARQEFVYRGFMKSSPILVFKTVFQK